MAFYHEDASETGACVQREGLVVQCSRKLGQQGVTVC
jgi:hypothetical protein